MSSNQGTDSGRSAGLTLNLASNNPFRNRAASPSSPFNMAPSPTNLSPFDDPPPRPVSRNPFLEPNFSSSQPDLIDTSNGTSSKMEPKASPTAEELFDSLAIEDKKPSRSDAPPRRPPPPPGRENMPPPGRRGPPPNHRPTRSQEEELRAKRMQGNQGPRPEPSGSSRSPQRRPERRPRRNSESSVADVEKPLSEEEKKARDARRRERERRYREAKERDGKERDGKESGGKKPSRRLDIIDQLDHTSLFGGGFHHDGPFDAVNPNRNRKGSRRAPMQAFPKDSLNMSLGGSGPLNKQPDHATFMGNGTDEAFKEYAKGSGVKNAFISSSTEVPAVFDPRSRAAMHGEESLGLGTSTFLEGTPAARTAIQKHYQEQAQQAATDGIQRKKSLAHRIRNMNKQPREFQSSGRMTNPEASYGHGSRTSPDYPSASSAGERNPFFNEYGKEPESLNVRRNNTDTMSPTSPPPPVPRRGSEHNGGAPLERRATNDALSPTEESGRQTGGGFLSRVKSLKGGRRNRQASDTMPPGTAA